MATGQLALDSRGQICSAQQARAGLLYVMWLRLWFWLLYLLRGLLTTYSETFSFLICEDFMKQSIFGVWCLVVTIWLSWGLEQAE